MTAVASVSLEDIRALVRRHAAAEADEWLDDWMRTWVPALQARPADLLETPEGKERVVLALQQGLHGIYV